MKVLHLCLANFYIDNYAYQENLLTRYQKKLGHEIEIIASTETYIDNVRIGYILPSEYVNEDGIRVIRIPYFSLLPLKINRKLRIYSGLKRRLEDFMPDIIFMHDTQFLSIVEVIRYKKRNPEVILLADSHTDSRNSAKTFFSKQLLHKIIYRHFVRKAEPYIECYYGTLPCRCSFLHEMYGIPESKIEYLPFGVDDEIAKEALTYEKRQLIRESYKVRDDEMLLVTGGKFDSGKYDIIKAINAVKALKIPVRLLIFGSVSDDIKKEFEKNVDNEKIIYFGWADIKESYELMGAADAAIFPCLHSTLWEQAVGLGLPCIFHYLEGYTHIDIGNNCIGISQITEETLKEGIIKMFNNIAEYKNKANICKKYFSYKTVAEKVLFQKKNL